MNGIDSDDERNEDGDEGEGNEHGRGSQVQEADMPRIPPCYAKASAICLGHQHPKKARATTAQHLSELDKETPSLSYVQAPPWCVPPCPRRWCRAEGTTALSLNLKVKSQDNCVLHFKIKKTTALKKLMERYCLHKGLQMNSTCFLKNGNRLCEILTPAELNMEDDDVIDARKLLATDAFITALDAVPAEDWCRAWAADRTTMLRMTSKRIKEVVDKMRPPAVVRLSRIFWGDARNGTAAEKLRFVFRQLTALAARCRISTLELRRCEMQGQDAERLEGVLAQCPALVHLDLSYNGIGDEGLERLAGALAQCPALAHLNLCNNKIGAGGAERLAGVLDQCTALAHLDLSDNHIGGEGAEMLRAAWCGNEDELRIHDAKYELSMGSESSFDGYGPWDSSSAEDECDDEEDEVDPTPKALILFLVDCHLNMHRLYKFNDGTKSDKKITVRLPSREGCKAGDPAPLSLPTFA
jgi:hypothetical protein